MARRWRALVLSILAVVSFSTFQGQVALSTNMADDLDWTVASNSAYNHRINSLVCDTAQDAIYATGSITGSTLSLVTYSSIFNMGNDPGIFTNDWPLNFPMILNGNKDCFIARFNLSGTLEWIHNFGGLGNDSGIGICLDASGNIYITGYFTGVAIFSSLDGTNSTPLVASGGGSDKSIFTLSYSPTGTLLWAKKAGGTSDDIGLSITSTSSGVVVNATFNDSGANIGGVALTNSSGDNGFAIIKYDFSGNVSWFKTVTSHDYHFSSSNYFESRYDITSSEDNLFALNFIGNLDALLNEWNSTTGIVTTALNVTQEKQLCLLSISNSGSLQWLRGIPQLDDGTLGFGIAADCQNVYLSSTVKSDFTETTVLDSFDDWIDGNDEAILLAKFDPASGADNGMKLFIVDGSAPNNIPSSLTTDGLGNIYMSVNQKDFIFFSDDITPAMQEVDGSKNASIVAFDTDLNALSYFRVPGGQDERCNDLALAHLEELHAAGTTTSTTFGDVLGLLNGNENAWLMQFDITPELVDLCCDVEPDAGQLLYSTMPDTAVCPGESVTIWLENATGSVQWMYRPPNGSWALIPGATEDSYTWTAVSDTQMMAMVTASDCSLVSYSDSIQFTLLGQPVLPESIGLIAVNCVASMPDIVQEINSIGCQYWIQDIAPGTVLSPGSYTLVLIEEEMGLELEIPLEVVDTENPVISIESPQAFFSSPDFCGATITTDELMVTINDCTPVNLDWYDGSGTAIADGVSFDVYNGDILTLVATDSFGNWTTDSLSILIVDTIAPILQSPFSGNSIVVTLDDNCTYTIPDRRLQLSVSDNCDTSIALTDIVQTPSPGTVVSQDFVLTFFVADASGNTSQIEVNVTVNDDAAPVLVCPSTLELEVGIGCSVPLGDLLSLVSVTDCSSIELFEQSISPSTTLTAGENSLVTILAIDAYDNFSSCQVDVIAVDSTPPSIAEWPADYEVGMDANCLYVIPDFTSSLVVAEFCGYVVAQNPAAGTETGIGTTQVQLTVSDTQGNSVVHEMQITVDDATSPNLICPDTHELPLTSGCDLNLGNLLPLIELSDCSDLFNLYQSYPASTVLTAGESLAVTITATDIYDNTATCEIEVIVVDETAPAVDWPADQTLYLPITCDLVLDDFISQLTTDEDCGYEYSQSPAAGTALGTGVTAVTLTVTDSQGNSSSHAVMLTVLDETAPQLDCPGEHVLFVTNSCEVAIGNILSLVSVSDCSSINDFSQSVPPTTLLAAGESIYVTVSSTDEFGNSSSCQVEVSLLDSTAPVVVWPANISVELPASCSYSLPDFSVNLNVTESCDYSVVQDPIAGTALTPGNSTVHITVTDTQGNMAEHDVSVTITDTTVPSLDCPSTHEIPLTSGCELQLGNILPLVNASDCSTIASLSQSSPPSTPLSGGETLLVTITATDGFDNTASCEIEVIVVDNTAPVINWPADITIDLPISCDLVLQDFIVELTTDEDCGYVYSQSPTAGTPLGTGVTAVTLTVTDGQGNSSEHDVLVTVLDKDAPQLDCPESIEYFVTTSCEMAIGDILSQVDIADCSDIAVFNQSLAPSTVLMAGQSVGVEINAEDEFGNAAWCTIEVAVFDIIAPIVEWPEDAVVPLPESCTSTVPDFITGLQVTEYCDYTATQNPLAGTPLTVGTNTIHLVVTDTQGNASEHDVEIMLSDVSPPEMECPSDHNVAVDMTCTTMVGDLLSLVQVSDCSDISLFTQSIVPETVMQVATTLPVVINAADEFGNNSTCTINVHATDETAPIVFIEEVIPFFASSGFCGALITMDDVLPTVNDCSPVTFEVYDDEGNLVSDTETFPVFGGDQMTLVTTDAFGNQASNDFSISIVDNTGPVISSTQIGDTLFVARNSDCFYMVEDLKSLMTVFDNCDGSLTPSDLIQAPQPGSMFSDDFDLFFTTYDATGNQGQTQIVVSLIDATGPEMDCPTTHEIQVGVTCDAMIGDLLTLVDTYDCSDIVEFSQSTLPESYISLGENIPVTISTTDEFGNNSTCNIEVIAIDAIAPIVTWPLDMIIEQSISCDMGVPDFSAGLEVIENCDYNVVQTPTAGSEMIYGLNTIHLTVTDAGGNAVNHDVQVTVHDISIPEIDCPPTIEANAGAEGCGAMVPLDVSTWDNCGIASLEWQEGLQPGNFFPIGTTHQMLVATDYAGNISTCEFDVVVSDIDAPDLQCAEAIHTCDPVVNYEVPIGMDNCLFTVLEDENNLPSGSTFPLGLTVLYFSAMDESGNISTCSTDVHVYEIPDPTWAGLPSVLCSSDEPIELEPLYPGSEEHLWSGIVSDGNVVDPSLWEDGTYEITLTVFNPGCDASQSLPITIESMPSVEIVGDTEVCGTTSEYSVASSSFVVQWSADPEIEIASPNDPVTTITSPGYTSANLTVEVTNTSCSTTSVISISFYEPVNSPTAGEDHLLLNGDGILLEGNYEGPGATQWSVITGAADIDDPFALITMAYRLATGINEFQLTASNGPCPASTDKIIVEVMPFVIPNGFSPNDDGVNDTFVISGIGNADKCELMVFDRVGNSVYRSDIYQNDWMGENMNQEKLADDTYFYDIKINSTSYTGFVVIKR